MEGKLITLFFQVLILMTGCQNSKPLHFIIYNNERTDGNVLIVENFKSFKKDSTTIRRYVDSLIPGKIFGSFAVYKASSKTNPAHLDQFPRDIDRYSQNHDMILVVSELIKGVKSYSWMKNGMNISFRKGDVIIRDLD